MLSEDALEFQKRLNHDSEVFLNLDKDFDELFSLFETMIVACYWYILASGNCSQIDFASQNFSGIIYSFNVPVLPAVAQQAKAAGIPIKKHNIIYRLIDDVKEEINARLPAKKVAEVLG